MKDYPIHERLHIGMLLAMAAGGFDAYTYLQHGEVFAGLQTGNLILLGIHIAKGDLSIIVRYLVPILSFLLGTIIVRFVQQRFEKSDTRRNRQVSILLWEMLLVLIVTVAAAHIPNMASSALVSLVAAAQLQEFRKLKGGPFTSLMMTGNLRTLGESYLDAVTEHSVKAREKGNDTLAIIVSFVVGAALMGLMVSWLTNAAIVLTLVPLGITTYFISTNKAK